MRLAPIDLHAGRMLALARRRQPRNQRRLLELGDDAEQLPDHLAGRRVVEERAGAVGRDQIDAARLEEPMAGFLHKDVAREAARRLDQDDAHAIARDALQHPAKAFPLVHRVGAAHGRVIELGDDLEPRRLGVGLDRRPLPLLAVLVHGIVTSIAFTVSTYPLAGAWSNRSNYLTNISMTAREPLLARRDGVDVARGASGSRKSRPKMVVVETTSEGATSVGKSIINLSSVTTVGLDLAKRVFQVHSIDASGRVVVAKAIRRNKLLELFASLPRCLVGLEASGSAHHWARELIRLGHEAQPYIRRQENDASNAPAICKAVPRPSMRFVGVRSLMEQAALLRHKAREVLGSSR